MDVARLSRACQEWDAEIARLRADNARSTEREECDPDPIPGGGCHVGA